MARVVLNHKGFDELLKSPEVQADLRRRAEAIAAAADGGGGRHVVRTEVGKKRARAAVITADAQAMLTEARTQNLTRALAAGRG